MGEGSPQETGDRRNGDYTVCGRIWVSLNNSTLCLLKMLTFWEPSLKNLALFWLTQSLDSLSLNTFKFNQPALNKNNSLLYFYRHRTIIFIPIS